MIRIPGGTFAVGNGRFDGYPKDGEGPVHAVAISPYCRRYRVDSRSSNTPDSAAWNVGSRCAMNGH